jgi:DNA-binding XRE family transcriptional regulator
MNIFLKRARLQAGLTQEELAKAISTSLTSIWRWEQGTRPSPFYQTILCTYFQLEPAELGWHSQKETRGRKPGQGSPSRLPSLVDPFLPPLLAPLLGRESILADWQKQLCLPDSPHLFGILGLPGSGKTAVMQQLSTDSDVQRAFAGVFWAQVGPETCPQRHFQRWANLLGLDTLPTDLTEAQDLLRTTIGQRRMLFVLDDVWTREDVAPYLFVGGSACRYVLTTRQPGLAHLLCQKVWRLPDLAEDDAFELLVAGLPEQFVQEHQETLQTLVHSVGHLPLALVLMREVLRKEVSLQPPHRFRETMARLVNRAFSLETPNFLQIYSLKRSCSLYADIQQSETKLPEATQEVFHVLANTFQDAPFTENDALALFPHQQVSHELDCLMDAGFLDWFEQEQGLYHFHPILVLYTRHRSKEKQPESPVS